MIDRFCVFKHRFLKMAWGFLNGSVVFGEDLVSVEAFLVQVGWLSVKFSCNVSD